MTGRSWGRSIRMHHLRLADSAVSFEPIVPATGSPSPKIEATKRNRLCSARFVAEVCPCADWPSTTAPHPPAARAQTRGGHAGEHLTFESLGLSAHLLQTVREEGYTEPTPVQAQAIPFVLAGRDVLAAAQTRTRQTTAFTLPIPDRLRSPANTSFSP